MGVLYIKEIMPYTPIIGDSKIILVTFDLAVDLATLAHHFKSKYRSRRPHNVINILGPAKTQINLCS